jgi:hypothetical protein
VTRPAPVVLAGRLVRLEPLAPSHAAALAAAAGDRRGLTRVPEGVGAARAYVAEALVDAERCEALPFATVLAASGRVVGSTRFLDLQYWPVEERPPGVPVVAEIGATWLAPDVQRTGVNAEAKLLLLACGLLRPRRGVARRAGDPAQEGGGGGRLGGADPRQGRGNLGRRRAVEQPQGGPRPLRAGRRHGHLARARQRHRHGGRLLGAGGE